MTPGIQAGLATVRITPPAGTPMAGFAARTLPSTGVHDDLYVRALVVASEEPAAARTALVVADVVSLSPDHASAVRADVERATGIPASAVMVATTHTHGGPVTEGEGSHDVVTRLRRAAVTSVAEAMEDIVPVRMLLGTGHEPTVGRNRRRPGGITDPSVPVIRIEDMAGEVVGIVCCYACHPVTLGADNRLITADYPGAVVRGLEAVYPDAVAVFVTGCAGQINTGHSAEASLSTRPDGLRTFREMSRLGTAIAGAAVQAGEHTAGLRGTPAATAPAPGAPAQVRAVTVPVQAPLLPVEEPETYRAMAAARRAEAAASPDPGSSDAGSRDVDRLLRWAAWAERMADTSPHEPSVPLDVTVFRWGDIHLVGLPGEPFVELGLEIRRRAPAGVVVAGYANGCPGYVPHRSAYPEGGYEVLHAHRAAYSRPSAFAPEAGELLVEAALRAIEGLGRNEK